MTKIKKTSELELPQKECFLKHLFDSAFHSVIIFDTEGTIRKINATAEKWLKYNKTQLLGKKIHEKIHCPKDFLHLKKELPSKLKDCSDFDCLIFRASGKEVDEHNLTYISSEGYFIPVKVSIVPLIDSEGDLQAYAEIATDLTSFYETRNRLKVSEKTMATIIESAVDGIIIINEKGIILGFNRAAEKMFMLPAEKAIGKNVTILMPEPHRSNHESYIERYLKTDVPHIIGIGRKVEAVKSNGMVFPIDLAVGEVKLEEGRLFTGFVRDLTESIRLESERNSFFQMSLDLFCILDPKGNIKNANPVWFDILGYTPEEIQGHNLKEFIHPQDFELDSGMFNEILNTSELVNKNFRFRAKYGDYRWILWNSSIDSRNKVIYGVARDVSEQYQILAELKMAKADAEKLSDARGMFIAKMSHELRTPLNSIIGFSGILQKNSAGNFTDKELLYIDRIKRNGKTLLKLINSVLEFSRIDSGALEVYPENVNVSDLIHEIIDLMQVTIDEKDIKLNIKLPPKAVWLKTDMVKLRQIIQNLIDNAVKFSEAGEVLIRLKTENKTGKPLRLEIEDSGPGIPKENQQSIFEAFQQIDNSSTRRYGGAGLGLAIARSFAQLLGFSIQLETRPGHGSCFSLIFSKTDR
ncbi:MAG: PAS domain S-box protein [Candidatus Rifleibacteriota bacterium]